jgi:hypothetical protein
MNLPRKNATSLGNFRLSRLAQDAKDVKDELAVLLMLSIALQYLMALANLIANAENVE